MPRYVSSRFAALAAVFLLSGCMSGTSHTGTAQTLDVDQSRSFAAVHNQQNIERANRGLPALRQDRSLMQAAAVHAKDMAQRNFYSHYAPDGGDPMDRVRQAGGCRSALAENIAKDWTDDMKVFWAWMNSPKHYNNMMDGGFTRYGIGSYDGYYVMVYAGGCV